jgi:hypothetical protein
MTNSPVGARVNVEADLRIDVDGHSAALTSEGRSLTFTSDGPQYLWQALGDVGTMGRRDGARAVGLIADTLGAQDLELHVVGPRGEIAHLGAGAHSWWGRTVTGSSLVELGALRTLRPLGLSLVRRSRAFWPAVSAVGASAAAAAVVVVVVGSLRRRPSSAMG